MAVQEKLITAEEFAALPNHSKKYDLVEGVLIEMCRPKFVHGKLQIRIGRFIDAYLDQHEVGQATTESGYILSRNPDTVRGPDVAFISKARLEKPAHYEYIPMAPDLAVEIVSPNDTADEVATKVTEYPQAGTQLVWVVYPGLRVVHAYKADGTAQVIGIDGILDGATVLPGFTLPLRDIFQGIDIGN